MRLLLCACRCSLTTCSEYGFVKYPTAYGKAMNLARRMKDEFDRVLQDVDVIVTPTCPQPPKRHFTADAGPLQWAEHSRMFTLTKRLPADRSSHRGPIYCRDQPDRAPIHVDSCRILRTDGDGHDGD